MNAVFAPIKKVLLFVLLLTSYSSNAIYLDSSIVVMETEEEFLSRQVLNNSETTNMYFINLYQIDRPGKNEQASLIQNGAIMYTPLKMVIEAKKWEFFKIFYRGAQDEQERYYRMVIKEMPINAVKMEHEDHISLLSSIVSLDTYLVVRPKKMKFSYDYEAKTGSLKNTGNTFFKVMIHKNCDSSDEEAQVFNLLPGESYVNEKLKQTSRKFIIAFGKYIQLDDQCEVAL